jgi:hypothetical protein
LTARISLRLGLYARLSAAAAGEHDFHGEFTVFPCRPDFARLKVLAV